MRFGSRWLLAGCLVVSLIGGCASLQRPLPATFSERPRSLAATLDALTGDEGRSSAELALRARLEEVFARPALAISSWLEVAERAPGLRDWAKVRLLGLIDDAPLEAGWLARTRRIPELAELAEALALRLDDEAALDEARTRLGARFDWRRSPRLLPYPGEARSPPVVPSRLSEALSSRAGFIASPEEGPGLYAFRLTLPPGRHRVVVQTECAVAAFVGSELVMTHEALSELLPTRFAFEFSLPAQTELELHLVTRNAQAQARIFVDPATSPRAGEASDLSGPLGALGALEVALSRADIGAAARLAETLPRRSYFAHLVSARLAGADPSRAPERASAAAKKELEAALALEPDAAEARRALVLRLASDQELDQALRVLGPEPERLADAAIATFSLLDRERARSIAERAFVARPRSCRARADWLATGWERLLLHPDEVEAAFTGRLAPLPGLCLESRLRAAELMREGFDLAGARRVLAPLVEASGADPGAERARAGALMATIELARGAHAEATEHARQALSSGGADVFAGGVLATAQRLLGGPPAPRIDAIRDLGLPLGDARKLITEHLRTRRTRHPDSREVLLDDRFVRVLADGSLWIRVHHLVRVNDVQAVETVGELPIPDEAEILFVRTWKRERRGLRPLEPEDILEKATVSLPGLAPGDFAEWAYFYPVHASPRIAPGWRAPAHAFDSDRGPVSRARYTVSLAPGARIPVFLVDADIAPPEHPDARTWIFTATDLPRVFDEPLDPRPELRRRTVRVSSGIEHLPLARALAAELRYGTRATPTLASMYAEATAHLGERPSSDRILAALYDAVQERVQEPEEATPFDAEASWVADRGRGSRALLLTALCREAGLGCELVLARPLWEGAEPREPELERLYPLVRWAPVGGDAIWLDPTSRWMPFGVLPPALEGVFAMSVGPAPKEPLLTRTPAIPAGEDPERWGARNVAMHLVFDRGGEVAVEGSESLDGIFAASWRTALAAMNAPAREEILGRIVRQALPEATVESVTLEDLEEVGRPLRWKWRARTPTKGATRLRERGGHALVLALFPEGLTQDTVVLAERTSPLLLNRAVRLSLTLTAEAPAGWGFVRAPADVALLFDLGHLERRSRFEQLGTRVVLDKRFLLRPGVIEPSRYQAWSEAAVAIDRADLVELVIVPGAPGPVSSEGTR